MSKTTPITTGKNPDTLPSTDTLSAIKPGRSLEESLIHISDLLTCAAATAYESGDGLSGSKRALAFSTMHLVEMAKAELDQSLNNLPAH